MWRAIKCFLSSIYLSCLKLHVGLGTYRQFLFVADKNYNDYQPLSNLIKISINMKFTSNSTTVCKTQYFNGFRNIISLLYLYGNT